MNGSSPILLIDDDPAWLKTLADCLEHEGFAVRTADRPQAGLALLEKAGAVRAVVIDFRMPEMNGLELLRQIRQRRRHLPVLLLSGEDDPALAARALAQGARAFLCKTTAPRVLLTRLLRLLTEPEPARARPA
jgi:DNA-binding response OmpR family regulator